MGIGDRDAGEVRHWEICDEKHHVAGQAEVVSDPSLKMSVVPAREGLRALLVCEFEGAETIPGADEVVAVLENPGSAPNIRSH